MSHPGARRFSATDPEIARFVEWIRETEKDLWLYYLTDLGLMAHLAKYSAQSPFGNVEPIFVKIFSFIKREFPHLDFFELLSFMNAVEKFIADHKVIEDTFEYRSPP